MVPDYANSIITGRAKRQPQKRKNRVLAVLHIIKTNLDSFLKIAYHMVLGMYDVNYTSCSITPNFLRNASLRTSTCISKHLKAFLSTYALFARCNVKYVIHAFTTPKNLLPSIHMVLEYMAV